MLIPGPTWLPIPRCDRRLHSFVRSFCDGERFLEVKVTDEENVLEVSGRTLGIQVREGDLLVFENSEETSEGVYLGTEWAWQEGEGGVGISFTATITHFLRWLKETPESQPDEQEWWRTTLRELHDRLYDYGDTPYLGEIGSYRIWYHDPKRKLCLGVWWPMDIEGRRYHAGYLSKEGLPVNAKTFVDPVEAWQSLLALKEREEGIIDTES